MNNAAVADNMYRMKLSDDPNCTCGKNRQTVEHILLYCDKYVSERLLLKTKLYSIWQDSKASGNLQFDIQLLLNPFSTKLSLSDARKVAIEVENFLIQIDITLWHDFNQSCVGRTQILNGFTGHYNKDFIGCPG